MNQPYVKEYNSLGEIVNPIKSGYISEYPNRKERRNAVKRIRFKGNNKGVNLTVVKTMKYHRVYQQIVYVDKKTNQIKHKRIEHYLN